VLTFDARISDYPSHAFYLCFQGNGITLSWERPQRRGYCRM